MPLLSVIVPAYKVQGYLRECLDSILDQSFTDIEVIVVDDCSPDGSGRIMDEYAAHDSRVRVLHLPENVGLGRARNAGMAQAAGEYLWFVDSDDWLTPGSLRAVARRLRDTSPDVLIVNHRKVHWDPNRAPVQVTYFLHEAPEVFTLREWPRAVDVVPYAWNRVIRREFAAGLGLGFATGWYEDLSYTYPLYFAAKRISVLDRVCVNYRQRRVGAITRTADERHLDLFDQYDRVFAELERLNPGEAEDIRPHLFARMIWHYLKVLANEQRIARGLRRRFFLRAHEHYRRYLPAGGYPMPGGGEGVKQRLLGRGAYRAFELGREANQTVTALRGRLRRLARGAKGRVRGGLRAGRDVLLHAYYRVQLRLPRDQSLALYAAYWYRGYACNPAAIYAKARELAPQVRGVWVVNRGRAAEMPAGVEYVVAGTRAYFRALARASWLVNNVNFPDLVVKRPGAVHVMTHHGTPLKRMGVDEFGYPGRSIQDAAKAATAGAPQPRRALERLLQRCDRWDFSVAQNPFTTEIWERSYPSHYESVESGYPRNDRLATATAEQVEQARARLGLQPGQTAVLYAPTHREYHREFRPTLDVEELADELGPQTIVLSRAHYFYVRPAGGRRGLSGGAANVQDVSTYPVVEDLYLAADVLITDYSSLMFDYAVLDRPIIIFASDWDTYRAIRGVTFDLLAEPPGAVATSYQELVDLFTSRAYAGDAATKARAQFRARFCALEDGRAAERVVRRVFLGQRDGHS